jgi:hypothetical protein
VLRFDALLAAAELCGGAAGVEGLEDILHDPPPVPTCGSATEVRRTIARF